MKTIIIYKSKTGFTKQYAKLLSDALTCQMIELKEINQVDLNTFDRVIYGGSLMASKINGLKTLLKNISNKELIIFAVGAYPHSDKYTKEVKEKNQLDTNLDHPLFYMQGGFDADKLNVLLKFMLTNIAKSIEKKSLKNPDSISKEDQDFMNFFKKSHDNVNPKNILPLLEYIKSQDS